MTRRDFIKNASVAAAAAVAAPVKAQRSERGPDIHLFSKPLHWITDYGRLAGTAAAMGISGIDLTVRTGGHVLPESVKDNLPKAVKAAEAQGLKITMIVTAISADDPAAETILKTAADCGVQLYRMGYFHYDFKKGIAQSLAEIKKSMESLAQLNQRLAITGCYQNHHAWQPALFGGAVWDIHHTLRDIDPQHLGCQYDVRHAIAESTGSWSTGTRLIAPWIRSLCLKDFDLKGERRGMPYPRNVPAGDGMVPWKEYFKLLEELSVNAPATVHIEWELLSREEQALPEERKIALVVERCRKECDFYRKAWSA